MKTSKAVVTIRCDLPIGDDSIWFTEEQFASMTKEELEDMLWEDMLSVLDEAVDVKIERVQLNSGSVSEDER